MKYLDATNTIHEIEDKYDVMSIKYKGVSVWPYLRIYICDSLNESPKAKGYSSSAISLIFKDLFHYNVFSFFRKCLIWDYSSSYTRKQVGELYEHHVSGFLANSGLSYLMIETPISGFKRLKKKDIPEEIIVSESWARLLSGLIEMVLRIFPLKIEGEDVLKAIYKDYNISLNYHLRLRWLYAQKKTTDFFLAIGRRPKLFTLECYYSQMGRIWSAHNHYIPVVELQHGVLNASHYAYNSKFHSKELYPDEILVYGEQEYNYFTNVQKQFVDRVSKVGLYILERSSTYFSDDIFKDIRKEYNKLIVVAGQTGFEEQLSSFIDSVAKELTECYFIYIPRLPNTISFSSQNVKYIYGVNIYEYLKWCDVHVTISSTTCLEAHYFERPVVFCDFNGVAQLYYGSFLKEENGAYYLNNKVDFINTIRNIPEHVQIPVELFSKNNAMLTKQVLKRYLNKN